MSSINPHYTFQYSQPEAYRFSHDSVFLARRAFEYMRDDVQPNWRVLDMCAGCGIIGLDFLFHCQKELSFAPMSCDFLEIQKDYEPHFEVNRRQIKGLRTQTRFLNQNYADELPGEYDLILCNPPYFEPQRGKLSPVPFKNRCRFFLDASHEQLLQSIAQSLNQSGRAYVLTRNPHPPQNQNLKAQSLSDIRGTPLLAYTRHA